MLNPAYLLKNPFQHYEWGSRTAIYELLGCSPISGEPVAELWMGSPSQITFQSFPEPRICVPSKIH